MGETLDQYRRRVDNEQREKKGSAADVNVAVADTMEKTDLAAASRRNAKSSTPSEDEAMPKQKAGESAGDFGARMRGWRERKQAAQQKGFDRMSEKK